MISSRTEINFVSFLALGNPVSVYASSLLVTVQTPSEAYPFKAKNVSLQV